jgi:hypothetical protein
VTQVTRVQPATQVVTHAAASAAGSATKAVSPPASSARQAVKSAAAAAPTAPPPPIAPPVSLAAVPAAAPAADAPTAVLPIDVAAAVQTPASPVALTDAVEDVLDQVDAVSASTENAIDDAATIEAAVDTTVVDEVQSAVEATVAPVADTVEATHAVLPAHAVTVSAHAIDAAANRATEEVVPQAADEVERVEATAAVAPVPVPQALQTVPVHDSWAVEQSAPIAAEDLAAKEAGATEHASLAVTIGPPWTWEALGPSSADVRPAGSPAQLSWAGMGRSAWDWNASSLSARLEERSSGNTPVPAERSVPPLTSVPAGMGQSTSVVGGWLTSISELDVTRTWRPRRLTAQVGRAVIVLPNLAPPG